MTETHERTMTIPETTQRRIWGDIQKYGRFQNVLEKAKQRYNSEKERRSSKHIRIYRTKIDTTARSLRECGILTDEATEAIFWASVYSARDFEKARQTLKDAGFTIELKKEY